MDTSLKEAEECRLRGNELLNKGDFADAVAEYDKGLVALLSAKGEQDDGGAAIAHLRAALHLNASLAHLRRGNLASAIDHATGALAVEPKTPKTSAMESKALYRRGMARKQLAEYQGESLAGLAQEDFERALQLDPQNREVRTQLQQLREQLKDERRILKEHFQSSGFRNIFSKQLYETEVPKPVVRETSGKDKCLLVSTSSLNFDYSGDSVLKSVDLELREAWCVGLVGLNASGKTTLARLLKDQLKPRSGMIQHHGLSQTPQRSPWTILAVLVVLLGIVIQVYSSSSVSWRQSARLGGFVSLGIVGACCLLTAFYCGRPATPKHLVLHLSSETSDKDIIKPSRTIASVIGDSLPKNMAPTERQEKVISMLQAAGFQMYNQETGEPVGSPAEYVRDGLTFERLSGGQKHLIYVLMYFAKCLASPHRVLLVCDEVLGGLDAIRQPRVLRMLKQLQVELKVGMLYITTELHQIHILADDLAFLQDGIICELGPAADVLNLPKHPATKDYVSQFRGLPGGQHFGGKLAESYEKLSSDVPLSRWLS
ncbi:Methionine import ATP-binding protein MetN 1 [Durusdinium trenchii]|uniref:Methionine import ATP-binding protein MetN 1 n=1 Tax=Durusdinium trenchii TaxID=1381693 RepID=A0ABP0NM43_9DINO